MSKGKHRQPLIPKTKGSIQNKKVTSSLLDVMEDGREFESIVGYQVVGMNLINEYRKSITEIENIRKRPLICYFANIINSRIKMPTSIEFNDELPFSELVNTLSTTDDNVDVLLVTNGGSGQQVAKFVTKLRSRFSNVAFIIPSIAMSAGTIFIMSGDEIIMGPDSVFGPIDPQIPSKLGLYVPAQSILTLIKTIQARGQKKLKQGQSPLWTDLEILRNIDPKEIGNAYNASGYSINLVRDYLYKYKFKTWTVHESTNKQVTDQDRKDRAEEVAKILCNHELWKSHSNGINREVANTLCKLKITHTETIPGMDKALRRFWAFSYWVFENTKIGKAFISKDYCILRNDVTIN